MKFQHVFVFMPILCLFLGSCLPDQAPEPIPEPTSTPITDPCFSARIKAPEVAESESMAGSVPVPNEIEILWNLDDCNMIVQSYQGGNPDPVRHHENVRSGSILEIGAPGSGITEIKIWVKGINIPSDTGWVTITE